MIIELPTSVSIPRKTMKDRKIYLNLNTYRNLHHRVENQCKHIFTELVEPLIKPLEPLTGILHLTYTYYPASNRKCDVANMCVIVDKYFSDALTIYGKIPDDNYTVLPMVTYQIGEVVKGGKITVNIDRIEL